MSFVSVIVHFKVSNCVFVTDLLLLFPTAENCQCLPYSANIVFFSCLDMFILVTSKSVQFIWQLGLKSIFYYLLSFLVYLLNLPATLSTPIPLQRISHFKKWHCSYCEPHPPFLISFLGYIVCLYICLLTWVGYFIETCFFFFFLVSRLWSWP